MLIAEISLLLTLEIYVPLETTHLNLMQVFVQIAQANLTGETSEGSKFLIRKRWKRL